MKYKVEFETWLREVRKYGKPTVYTAISRCLRVETILKIKLYTQFQNGNAETILAILTYTKEEEDNKIEPPIPFETEKYFIGMRDLKNSVSRYFEFCQHLKNEQIKKENQANHETAEIQNEVERRMIYNLRLQLSTYRKKIN